MDDNTRKMYDRILLWSMLKMDYDEFLEFRYSVSSPYTPNGLFSSMREMREYYNIVDKVFD